MLHDLEQLDFYDFKLFSLSPDSLAVCQATTDSCLFSSKSHMPLLVENVSNLVVRFENVGASDLGTYQQLYWVPRHLVSHERPSHLLQGEIVNGLIELKVSFMLKHPTLCVNSANVTLCDLPNLDFSEEFCVLSNLPKEAVVTVRLPSWLVYSCEKSMHSPVITKTHLPKPYEVASCAYAVPKTIDGFDDDECPLYFTTEMQAAFADLEDDKVVICIDGEEVHSAWKRNTPRTYTSTGTSTDSFTMYKRVDRKVKPVPAVFPEDARVIRKFPEDPLKSLPSLPVHPPDFIPDKGGRLTEERLKDMNINPDGFLWPEEEKLFMHILKLNQYSFVFEDSQRGSFREDYFSPYIIPVVPHVPWAFSNIPIPPGIKEKVVELLKEKIAAGVYEPSQSSYRSRWFCVLKKSGKLRLVHDLQPLNKVSIRDAGLPPNLDNFVEPFAGRQCYSVFDLYWGFDARKVHPESRDLTAFLTLLGLLRITSLPTGFTNSPAEFQACMTFILQDEIPHIADIFIDDLPIKGPTTIYPDINGDPELHPDNSGIRRFIWEHTNDVHRIVHRVGHAGGTFSPGKIQLCQPRVLIVGQTCTPEGRLPDEQKIEKILKWPTLKTVKDVRGFLGLCGTV